MSVRILTGDVRERLADLPDGGVQCCVTSPPYFGLRDYGVSGQIGLEPTLAEYIAALVDVFRDVRRVLRDDGTCWLNLGDSYAGSGPRAGGKGDERGQGKKNGMPIPTGMKPKDLMMVPARVAIALQDDGWWLRSDIIWAKKNCMPESVTDRPTSSHEHIFLLTKNARYFYDAEAVREEAKPGSIERSKYLFGGAKNTALHNGDSPTAVVGERTITGRNQRNVWHLATEPFPDAHFATFPTEIPRRCIKAGTSEKGQCAACGAPWVRVVERVTDGKRKELDRGYPGQPQASNGSQWEPVQYRIDGWQPSCTCDAGEPVPQTVLDPFLGSGTTLLVADQLGRHGVGIELNPEYAQMAERRICGDAPMFAEVLT